jgi:polyisoprenoid-binding protein YceI
MRFFALALLLAGVPLAGQEVALEIDPARSTVRFELDAMLHTVRGAFAVKGGRIRFNPATGSISGEIVVDAASGSSGNEGRDRKMHTTVLESGRYPEIILRPVRIAGPIGPGSSKVQMAGVLAIHGAEHEVTIPLTVEISGGRYHAVGEFRVPYVKWSMKNPSNLFLRVKEYVDLSIDAIAIPVTASN